MYGRKPKGQPSWQAVIHWFAHRHPALHIKYKSVITLHLLIFRKRRMRKIKFRASPTDHGACRIGGCALIGGITEWPTHPNSQEPLTLVASLEASTLFNSPVTFKYVSIFSYYSSENYFLDEICYHGSPEELKDILDGTSRVMLHAEGLPISEGHAIPEMEMHIEDNDSGLFHGSGVGDAPCLLQHEPLDLAEFEFKLQLYSSDFPKPFNDIFGISDAIGYLYINKKAGTGLFFVQTT